MARPIRHVPRDSSRRRLWVYLAVGTFLLVDIALIAFALGYTRSTDIAETARPAPSFDAQVTSEPTATSEAAPASVTVVSVPPARMISAVDDTTAWRAVSGECPATAVVPELTTDAGATWSTRDATAQTEVTAVQTLTATSDSILELVGLAATDCAPQFVQTFVGGDTFKAYPDKLGGAWFVNPADRAVVHSPAGDAAAPCESVIALAPRDAKAAAVLCADQTVFTTEDAAETWSVPATVLGAVNVAATPMGYIFTAVGLADCAGVQLTALSAESLTIATTGCLLIGAPPETLSGNIAVSEASGTMWLWAGNELKRSSDGGMTWQ